MEMEWRQCGVLGDDAKGADKAFVIAKPTEIEGEQVICSFQGDDLGFQTIRLQQLLENVGIGGHVRDSINFKAGDKFGYGHFFFNLMYV